MIIVIIKNKGNKSIKHIKNVVHVEQYTLCGYEITHYIKVCTAEETHHVNLKQNRVLITEQ